MKPSTRVSSLASRTLQALQAVAAGEARVAELDAGLIETRARIAELARQAATTCTARSTACTMTS